MNVKDMKSKIFKGMKKEEEENKINKEIISDAIVELFSTFRRSYGTIRKVIREDSLKIFVKTGGWYYNEKAVKKFNETAFRGATVEWFRKATEDCDYDEYDCDEYEWDIPLFLVDDAVIENVRKWEKY